VDRACGCASRCGQSPSSRNSSVADQTTQLRPGRGSPIDHPSSCTIRNEPNCRHAPSPKLLEPQARDSKPRPELLLHEQPCGKPLKPRDALLVPNDSARAEPNPKERRIINGAIGCHIDCPVLLR
jgi:hypothetical protein